jgi:hypothetical protein
MSVVANENNDVTLFREVNCKMRLFAMKYSMDQFRNDVALLVKKLRGRYDAIFIEPENVSKIN